MGIFAIVLSLLLLMYLTYRGHTVLLLAPLAQCHVGAAQRHPDLRRRLAVRRCVCDLRHRQPTVQGRHFHPLIRDQHVRRTGPRVDRGDRGDRASNSVQVVLSRPQQETRP